MYPRRGTVDSRNATKIFRHKKKKRKKNVLRKQTTMRLGMDRNNNIHDKTFTARPKRELRRSDDDDGGDVRPLHYVTHLYEKIWFLPVFVRASRGRSDRYTHERQELKRRKPIRTVYAERWRWRWRRRRCRVVVGDRVRGVHRTRLTIRKRFRNPRIILT